MRMVELLSVHLEVTPNPIRTFKAHGRVLLYLSLPMDPPFMSGCEACQHPARSLTLRALQTV